MNLWDSIDAALYRIRAENITDHFEKVKVICEAVLPVLPANDPPSGTGESGWRDIASVPTNGSMVWLGTVDWTCLARFEDDPDEPGFERWGGRMRPSGTGARWKDPPTHWCPYTDPGFPPPPQTGPEGEAS